MDQKKLFEYGFEKPIPRKRKNNHPVNAVCVSCGKQKLLTWIVDGQYICDDCIE